MGGGGGGGGGGITGVRVNERKSSCDSLNSEGPVYLSMQL